MNNIIDEIAETRAMERIWFIKFLDEISTDKLDSSISESLVALENSLAEESQKEYEQYIETNYYDSEITDNIRSQLLHIYEVKVIFLFKNVEKNLKRIISMAYDTALNKHTNWPALLYILQSKKINYNTSGFPFEAIDQLRIVNNNIKHSYDEMSPEMLKIKEFKRNLIIEETDRDRQMNSISKKNISYEDLKEFYDRVKESTRIWIDKIGAAIYSDKFEFSNKRLRGMALELASKLDEEKAIKLMENLKRLY